MPERGPCIEAIARRALVDAAAQIVLQLSIPDAATRAIERGLLPRCYAHRYDDDFVEQAINTVALVRNALVGDLPFVASTGQELAARAVFREAFVSAAATGGSLPSAVEAWLRELEETVLQDDDVLMLFDVPAGEDPLAGVPAARQGDWALLRFENWLRPFGGAPEPVIGTDGRARLQGGDAPG